MSNEFTEWFDKHDEKLLFMECEDIAREAFWAGVKSVKNHQCSVTDLQGNHCPEIPLHTIFIDGEEVWLCKRCFENAVYRIERRPTQRAVDGATHCACGLGLLPDGTCPMHFQYITHRN
jgi:hypothetical protein